MTQADIQKYREQIEADLAWRLEEIAFFAKQLNHFKARNVSEEEREKAENDKKRFRKSLVFILYAHFEGFFRFAFETYVNALNEDNIALSKTIDVLVVSSLYKILVTF